MLLLHSTKLIFRVFNFERCNIQNPHREFLGNQNLPRYLQRNTCYRYLPIGGDFFGVLTNKNKASKGLRRLYNVSGFELQTLVSCLR